MEKVQAVKPKNPRAARALAKREPQATENPKTVLFLRYTSTSELVNMVMRDLHSLRKPLAIRFNKKNTVRPFEDASSFEFFAEKNDTSLICYGSHLKKRPHAITLARCFDNKILDMLELLIVPDTLRTLQQFHGRKPSVGLKPLVCFAGSVFESPTPNAYTLAKSIFLDFFRVGPEIQQVDVEGLQYVVSISADEEVEGQPAPQIHLRCYMVRTKRSGSRLPLVELEEMGPRVDFRVGRLREPDPDMLKEAMKKPKTSEPKAKKNVETDLMGDKMGRIHLGKQNLSKLQTRKMKGLKRGREDADGDNMMADGAAQSPKKTRPL